MVKTQDAYIAVKNIQSFQMQQGAIATDFEFYRFNTAFLGTKRALFMKSSRSANPINHEIYVS